MIMVCRPYRGVTPTNKPQEMDSAFTLLLPWLSKIFSTKNLFHPFLRKYLKRILGFSSFFLILIFFEVAKVLI
jgi:hypothetical protein